MIIAKTLILIFIAIFLFGFVFPYKFTEFYCRLISLNFKTWGIDAQFKITSINKIKFFCLIIIVFLSYILYIQSTNPKQNISNINNNTNKTNNLILLKKGGAIQANISKEDSENIYIQPKFSAINKKDIDTIIRINNRDFLDVIFNRNSCYNFKYGDEIPDEHIQLMLRAAMSSPSGYNLKSWRFVVVKEKKQIEDLLLPIIAESGVGEGRLHANLMFVVCVPIDASQNAYTDPLLASVFLWLSAEYLNYAAAFVDIFPKRVDLFKTKLSIPKNIIPYSMVLVGYYANEKKTTNKFDISNIHYNSWN